MTVLLSLASALFAAVFNVAGKRCISGRQWSPFHFTLSYSVLTGLISLPVLPFLGPGDAGAWQGPFFTALFLLAGHSLLAIAFSRGDASAIAPLLGLKVLFVPLVAVLFTDETVRSSLWLAAVLCVGGIYLLNTSDGSRGWRDQLLSPGVLLMIGCTLSYAAGDTWIRVSQEAWGNPLRFFCIAQATFGALCVALLLLGRSVRFASNAALPFFRPPAPLPYRPLLLAALASWLSQLALWISFRLAGAVTLPNILMSTRGVLTILLILLLSRLGYGDIVQEYQSRRVYVFRLLGASLMVAALIVAVWI